MMSCDWKTLLYWMHYFMISVAGDANSSHKKKHRKGILTMAFCIIILP